MLRRFHEEEARSPWAPTAVEEEFAFLLERNRVQGRYDLVIEKDGEVSIVDFKTGDVREEKAAQKRAKESLQLDIYALAHLKTKGRLPERVELRFLESGLAAGRRPTAEDAAATEERIRAASAAIRRRLFPAKPTWMACSQCPFREICPHTAWGGGDDPDG
jgi:DNA helicase-2/ATP-dependent DNA helicase PcrA